MGDVIYVDFRTRGKVVDMEDYRRQRARRIVSDLADGPEDEARLLDMIGLHDDLPPSA